MPNDALIMRDELPAFVVLADDWGRHVSSAQHLFRAIAHRRPVIWVNSYGHRTPRLTRYDLVRAVSKVSRMILPEARRVVSSGEPLAIVNPRALPWHSIQWVHHLNTRSIAGQIRSAVRTARLDRFVFVTETPLAVDMLGMLGESAAVYFCLDDYDVLPGVEPGLLVPFERRMVTRVDAVAATARTLLETRTPPSGLALHLPQGVNYEHFANPRAIPVELRELPRPLIGFAGGVGPVLDWPLLRSLALAMPNASVVLVGMQQEEFSIPDLPPNVHILGPRPYVDLPAYVQAFDVALIPYVLNQHTLSVDPLKLLEYLASGRPVVSTPLLEVHKYAEHVAIAASSDAFISAVRALADRRGTADSSDAKRRQEFAATHTWQERASTFLSFVARAVEARASSDEILQS